MFNIINVLPFMFLLLNVIKYYYAPLNKTVLFSDNMA